MKSRGYKRRQNELNGKDCSRKYHRVVYDTNRLEDTEKVSLRLVQEASPYSSSVVKTLTGRTKNLRVMEDAGKKKRRYSSTLRKNVGRLACSGKILSEDYTHNFSILSGYNGLKRSRKSIITTNNLAESSEDNGSDDVCSVGSCSLNDWGQKGFSGCSTERPCPERGSLFSDAESCCWSSDKEDNFYDVVKEKKEVSVHDLELHAYRCTLEAFYVSGPLSWEQEELLTNLRITLHISNDEHLRELRNLITSGTGR